MSTSSPSTSYDEIPYPSVPFVQSHPDRLATVATLHGMDPAPPPVEGCRVLELGCARGDNLIPLALGLPQAEFIGMDLSPQQIADARTAIEQLGVGNVEFRQADVLDFPRDLGRFDYVIAHGIYSWVPVDARDAILDICREHLRPNGVAYVSYNTLPGWRARGIVRDALIYHCRRTQEPRERMAQAAAFLEFLCGAVPEQLGLYRAVFADARERLAQAMDPQAFLFHEYLEQVNDPVYFSVFAAHAARHGLQFLAEAEFTDARVDYFPSHVMDALDRFGGNFIEREQYLDFLKNTIFRRSLLCHRDVSFTPVPDAGRIRGLHVASGLRCEAPEADLRSAEPLKFRDREGVEGATDHPITKAALLHLSEAWPEAVPFDELQQAARVRLAPEKVVVMSTADFQRDTDTLVSNLYRLCAAGSLELHVCPPRFVTQVSARPVASPWARRQAAVGPRVTNLRHDGLELSEESRRLIRLLDGTRDQPDLLEALVTQVKEDGRLVVHEGTPIHDPDRLRRVLAAGLDESLQTLAGSALLMA